MEDPRKVANRESAQKSRDEQRQRLGDVEYKRQRADAERERRRKMKKQAEMAEAAEELELEQQQQPLAEQAQAQQQAQAQAQAQLEEIRASAAAEEQQMLQALRQQREEEQAKLDADKAAAAAATAPPPPPQQPAPPPPPAAPTAESPPSWQPLPDGLIPLSDKLGVSSAPNLGGSDVRKLAQVLDTSGDIALVDGALRRLKVVKLTPELSRSTGIDQKVKELQSHENPGVCALSKTISIAWSTQLTEELKLRAQKSKTGPKSKGTGAASCPACQGRHRAHTCC